MVELRKSLISNTVYLIIAWVSSIILNFSFQLLAAKTLIPQELGVLSTAINFAAIFSSILIFGMEQTTQRLAAYYIEKNKIEYLRSVLWFFLFLTIILNIIVISGLLIFSPKISHVLNVPTNVLYVSIAVLFPLSMAFFLAGVLRGYQKMKQLTVTGVISDFIKLIAAVFLVASGYKIFAFLIGYLVSGISLLLIRISNIRLFITTFKFPNIKLIFTYAVPSIITQLFWLLLLNGQYLIISAVKGSYETGLFTVGMILSNQIYFIPRIISDALFPISSSLSANKKLVYQQRNLLNLALRYSLLASLPILFFVAIFPKPLIFLIGRPTFFPVADIIPILITASLFFGISTLLSRTLYAIGKSITFQNISIIAVVFYLVSSVPLTYLLSTLGTALAFLCTTLLVSLASLFYLRKYMEFKLDLVSISKILISSLLTFGLLYSISFFVPNLITGGILTAIFTLIYFSVLYFLRFYDENDIKILDFMSEKMPLANKPIRILRALILKQIKVKAE